jgi:hypothetical protein
MAHIGEALILKTWVFTLCVSNYKNLTELAHAMDISVSQVYRVLEGKPQHQPQIYHRGDESLPWL